MNVLILFLLGAALGQITSIATRAPTQQRSFNNVAIGVIGAFLGGLLLPRAIGAAGNPVDIVDGLTLGLAAFTAAVLLVIVTLIVRRFGREG